STTNPKVNAMPTCVIAPWLTPSMMIAPVPANTRPKVPMVSARKRFIRPALASQIPFSAASQPVPPPRAQKCRGGAALNNFLEPLRVAGLRHRIEAVGADSGLRLGVPGIGFRREIDLGIQRMVPLDDFAGVGGHAAHDGGQGAECGVIEFV